MTTGSTILVNSLPHEQSGTAPEGRRGSRQNRSFAIRGWVLLPCARKPDLAGHLVDLNGTMTIHDRNCSVGFVAWAGRKHDAPAAPHAGNVFRCMRVRCPNRPKVPRQRHFEIDMWCAHNSG